MAKNLPCMRLSSWTRPNHSVSVLRLDSKRILLARVRADLGAVSGRVLILVSLIFHPYLLRSSLIIPCLFASMCVLVLSVGLQSALVRTSTICLWLDGLKDLSSHLQKGYPLNSVRSPSLTHLKSFLCKLPCL